MDRNSSNVDFPPHGVRQKVARAREPCILHNLNFSTATPPPRTWRTRTGLTTLREFTPGELLFIRILAPAPRRKFFTPHTLRRVNRMFSSFNPEKRINFQFSPFSEGKDARRRLRVRARARSIDRSIDQSLPRLICTTTRRVRPSSTLRSAVEFRYGVPHREFRGRDHSQEMESQSFSTRNTEKGKERRKFSRPQ